MISLCYCRKKNRSLVTRTTTKREKAKMMEKKRPRACVVFSRFVLIGFHVNFILAEAKWTHPPSPWQRMLTRCHRCRFSLNLFILFYSPTDPSTVTTSAMRKMRKKTTRMTNIPKNPLPRLMSLRSAPLTKSPTTTRLKERRKSRLKEILPPPPAFLPHRTAVPSLPTGLGTMEPSAVRENSRNISNLMNKTDNLERGL